MLRLPRGRPHPAATPAFLDVPHGRATLRIAVRRSPKARRITLRVRAATGDVVLTLPLRASFTTAKAFAERHGGWIEARLGRLSARVPFAPGAVVPLRGISHRIVHRPGVRGTVWTEQADEPLLCVAGAADHLARRVTDYLKREARRDLQAAVDRHAAALGVAPRAIVLRDTTSRWGSCSSKGSLSFSWRLILAPPPMLDYLAAHEMAHLRHMNHGPAFWALTRRLAPQTAEAEAWLKAHGAGLHRFGRRGEDDSAERS